MAEIEHILGIPEIDQGIATALPPGWMAVLTGTSGSGAPLLAKQFAHAGVGSAPVLYYTTYERTLDVEQAFRDFGWDPGAIQVVNLADEYFQRVLLRGLDVARAREKGLSLDQLGPLPSDDRSHTSFSVTNRLLADLAAIDTPFRLVLDSVDFFFEVLQPHDVAVVARQIRHRCQSIGGQALITVHSRSHDRAFVGLLQDLADVVFDLQSQPDGDHYAHTLFVEKVRNRPDLQRIAHTVVTDGGFRIKDETKEGKGKRA